MTHLKIVILRPKFQRIIDDTFNRPIQMSYRLQFVGVDVI